MKQLKIDMISESEFTIKGHGVHTAYLELTNALKARSDTNVKVNDPRSDADITHIQTVGVYALQKLLFAKGKKVVSAHIIPASFIGSLAGAKYWAPFSKIYLKWFYGRADMVFAVSGMVRQELVQNMGLRNPVVTFYNTVQMNHYKHTASQKAQARAALGMTAGDFLVIGNGQVQPRKRLDTFVATAKACPEMRFVWVGGIPFKHLGADYEKMHKIMHSLPPNVTMTGVISLEDVRRYLYAADAFFLPAEQENHPMCVLEAAGAGLPILLRDIPEYNDTFRPDALFVTDENVAATYLKKLQSDPDFYREYVECSGRIAARFDSSSGAERAMQLYRSLL